MTSTNNDMRLLTAAEIDAVTGGTQVVTHYPPPNGTQIVVTTSNPGQPTSYFQITTPNSTITATSGSISQSASTGTGSGFSSIST